MKRHIYKGHARYTEGCNKPLVNPLKGIPIIGNFCDASKSDLDRIVSRKIAQNTNMITRLSCEMKELLINLTNSIKKYFLSAIESCLYYKTVKEEYTK